MVAEFPGHCLVAENLRVESIELRGADLTKNECFEGCLDEFNRFGCEYRRSTGECYYYMLFDEEQRIVGGDGNPDIICMQPWYLAPK